MSTFYVLPPRECLEQAAAAFAARVLPGVPAHPGLWDEFLGLVAGRAGPDTFFVHREDLPGGDTVAADLAAGFGAEPGDAVVEVGLAVGTAPAPVRASTVPAGVPETPAGY